MRGEQVRTMKCALGITLLALGCGSPTRLATPESPPAPTPEPAETTDPRTLGEAATFADLVRAASTLDRRRDQDSDAGCLLAHPSSGWRLSADLSVAVRPLTQPGPIEHLRDGNAVVVLTRWGAYGEAQANTPAFNAITTTLPPAAGEAIVWVVTADGILVRSTRTAMPVDVSTLEQAASALSPSDGEPGGALFVAADGAVPLSRVAEVLASVPQGWSGRVAFAVALAPGVRLPARPEAIALEDDSTRCPDGVPALAEDAPLGVLRPDRIVASLGPLRQGSALCVGATSGGGAVGGRVVMALRIGPDGVVSEACVVHDGMDDPLLRACLIRAARGTAFEAPDPPGFVDVQLPLVLAPLATQRQRPLCE